MIDGAGPSPRAEKLSEILAKRILDGLMAREDQPGTTLPPEAVMADSFRVGRASLREALRILEIHGVVRVKPGPGGGPVIAETGAADLARSVSIHFQMNGTSLREVLEARAVMEPLMAQLAAERRTEADIEVLRAAVERDRGAQHDSDGDWGHSTADFHELVGRLAGNSALRLISDALIVIQNDRIETVFPVGQRSRIVDVHDRIAQAIIEADGTLARHLMQRHIEALRDRIADLYPGLLAQVITWR